MGNYWGCPSNTPVRCYQDFKGLSAKDFNWIDYPGSNRLFRILVFHKIANVITIDGIGFELGHEQHITVC
jgi:hypothetical protein